MEDFSALLDFLTNEKDNVRKIAIENVMQYTKSTEHVVFIRDHRPQAVTHICRLLADEPTIAGYAVATLINLSSDPSVLSSMLESAVLSRIMDSLKVETALELKLILLTNLTATSEAAVGKFLGEGEDEVVHGYNMFQLWSLFLRKDAEWDKALQELTERKIPTVDEVRQQILDQMAEQGIDLDPSVVKVTAVQPDAKTEEARKAAERRDYHWVLTVIINLTKTPIGRKLVLEIDSFVAQLPKLLTHENIIARGSATHTLKNILMDKDFVTEKTCNTTIIGPLLDRLESGVEVSKDIKKTVVDCLACLTATNCGVEFLDGVGAKKLLTSVLEREQKVENNTTIIDNLTALINSCDEVQEMIMMNPDADGEKKAQAAKQEELQRELEPAEKLAAAQAGVVVEGDEEEKAEILPLGFDSSDEDEAEKALLEMD